MKSSPTKFPERLVWSPVPPKMGPIYLLIKIIKYHFSVFSFPFLDGPIKIYYKLRAQLPCESGLPRPPLSEVMWLAPLHPHHQMGLCQLANMFLYFVYGLLFFSHFLWLGAFLSRSGKWGVGFVAFFFFLFWDKHLAPRDPLERRGGWVSATAHVWCPDGTCPTLPFSMWG